jgi:hypothetical protein
MAIKVTDTIQTSEGATTELYFHIVEFYRNKEGRAQFPVKYFLDETKTKEVKIFEGYLKLRYDFDISAEIGSDKIEKIAYDKIGLELKAAGLTVQSDESGAWVNY